MTAERRADDDDVLRIFAFFLACFGPDQGLRVLSARFGFRLHVSFFI